MLVFWIGFVPVAFITVICMPISVFCAPIAGFVCARQARVRGLNSLYYGFVGALYSVFLLLPWIYLTLRLRGRRVPHSLIVNSYLFIYMAWILCLLNAFVYAFFLSGSYSYPPNDPHWVAPLAFYAGGALFVLSVFALGLAGPGPQRPQDRTQLSSKNYEHKFVDIVYVAPFALTATQAVVGHLLILI